MATKFPKFSQDLAQDPTTRRIWYGIATAHDFESHDGMTEENLYQKIFASHFGHLAIIFLWTSGNLFHVAWQGNFEQWIKDPLNIRPIAHAIWDPQFGKPAVDAFTQAGASYLRVRKDCPDGGEAQGGDSYGLHHHSALLEEASEGGCSCDDHPLEVT